MNDAPKAGASAGGRKWATALAASAASASPITRPAVEPRRCAPRSGCGATGGAVRAPRARRSSGRRGLRPERALDDIERVEAEGPLDPGRPHGFRSAPDRPARIDRAPPDQDRGEPLEGLLVV